MSLEIIILASGRGLRMRSTQPRGLQLLGGKPLLGHVLDSAGANQEQGRGGDESNGTAGQARIAPLATISPSACPILYCRSFAGSIFPPGAEVPLSS